MTDETETENENEELRHRLSAEGQAETRAGAIDELSEELTDEELSGPVARRKAGTAKSGWCLEFNAGGHGRCPVTVGGFTCKCPCH